MTDDEKARLKVALEKQGLAELLAMKLILDVVLGPPPKAAEPSGEWPPPPTGGAGAPPQGLPTGAPTDAAPSKVPVSPKPDAAPSKDPWRKIVEGGKALNDARKEFGGEGFAA